MSSDDSNVGGRTSRRRYLTGLGTAAAVGVLGSSTVETAAAAKRAYFDSDHHLVSANQSGHQDVEPQIVSDKYGNLYTGSIRGVPAGSDVWKSTDSGETWEYLGQPHQFSETSDLGGGDIAMAVGTPHPNSPGNVYVSSLWLGSLYFSTSTDGGETWSTVNPVSSLPYTPVDRQWLATEGQEIVYQSFHDLETDEIDVIKSTDAGQTWTPVAPAVNPANLGAGAEDNELGNIHMDEGTGYLYQIWSSVPDLTANLNSAPLNTVYMSASNDGGQSWEVSKVYEDPKHGTDNIFPIVTTDEAGNVYAVWSDNTDIYYAVSPDHGGTWSDAFQVNTGADTNTAIFPWANGGAEGTLDVTFYGTDAASNTATDAEWRVYWTQVTDAVSMSPDRNQVQASDHVIHTGAVCEGGTGCSGNRQLADVFNMTLDPDGYAHIAYTDDHDSDLPPQTYVTNQVCGPKAYEHTRQFPLGFYVSGSRSDDASVFTAGQTDEVHVTVEPSETVPVRDVVPSQWDVLTAYSPDVKGVQTDAAAGVKYVYFTDRATADAETTYTYFAKAPTGASDTGSYTFGAAQVKPDKYWLDVSGTTDQNVVVGVQS